MFAYDDANVLKHNFLQKIKVSKYKDGKSCVAKPQQQHKMQEIMLSFSFEMIIMISTIFSRYHVYEQKDLMNLNAVFIGVLYI